MILSNYSFDEIRLHFLICYNIDVNLYEFSKKRMGQDEFRDKLIERYNGRCILTGTKKCQACHIIPHADSNNMFIDNGLLLSYQHHSLFDDYIISINPKTLCVELKHDVDSEDPFINMIDNKKIDVLEKYPLTCKYLEKHYSKFIESF